MAKTKKTTKKSTKPIKIVRKNTSKKLTLDNEITKTLPFNQQLKLSESYISLAIGALAVAVLAIVFFALLKGTSVFNRNTKMPLLSPTQAPVVTNSQKIHVMEENQSLWDVAVKYYGDGYKWPQILEANKEVIDNPDFVPPGTKIIIPEVK